ncbi:translesion error-prone DNA polymerase V autoproteolytic subunit [Desulfurispira natronophila]|uniref:DNA polymerase V n=1 Tax=Desulfurispira natronophila TaxID=682562 RepID=A0A7W7Y6E0_9BACT|nr:translesion error-prone DNA polymerase V autoproteolytic subunit [Desulfurispira natronophila]MBB5022587.1 DNA polymerase V [Desulfurispira natronophila]
MTTDVQIIGKPITEPSLYPSIPHFCETVMAGFPSPAQDYIERNLDLNELCIRNPTATYFVQAQGDSMIEGNIHPGDTLVVDRSLEPRHGDVVIAALQGELTMKRLELHPSLRLVPMNPSYQPIAIIPDEGLDILGVVTHVLHTLRQI